MIVVGGTYSEVVEVPEYQDDVSGSGMRAAAALRFTDVSLVTAIDEITSDAASAAAASLGIERVVSIRDQPVGFRYFTPVSDPAIDGPTASFAGPLRAESEAVLVFGMIERGELSVQAERLILDPQRPRDLVEIETTGLSWNELAVVANRREIAALSRVFGTSEECARDVLERSGAAVVVVKDSGRGCLVVLRDRDLSVRVGPFPTRTVWPLGSGDVFAAGFAHAWSEGADPVESARLGSNCAAWWCGSRPNAQSAIPIEILSGSPVTETLETADSELEIPEEPPVIYLASPFFALSERWLVELCRDVLLGLGAEVFSPFHSVGVGGDEVAEMDLAGLDRADAVLAILDGWDPGTLYEVGWAHRKGLPVVGFLNSTNDSRSKMPVGAGAEIHRDLSSALYRVVWAGQGQKLVAGRV
ncbi:MAG: PfkB family carbohydrate kinase [Acidimicrobiales bacterium]